MVSHLDSHLSNQVLSHLDVLRASRVLSPLDVLRANLRLYLVHSLRASLRVCHLDNLLDNLLDNQRSSYALQDRTRHVKMMFLVKFVLIAPQTHILIFKTLSNVHLVIIIWFRTRVRLNVLSVSWDMCRLCLMTVHALLVQ